MDVENPEATLSKQVNTEIQRLFVTYGGSGAREFAQLTGRLKECARVFDRDKEIDEINRRLRDTFKQHSIATIFLHGRECDDVKNILDRVAEIEKGNLADHLGLNHGFAKIKSGEPDGRAPLELFSSDWPWFESGFSKQNTDCATMLHEALSLKQLSVFGFRLPTIPEKLCQAKGWKSMLSWPGKQTVWNQVDWINQLMQLCEEVDCRDVEGKVLVIIGTDRPNKTDRIDLPLPCSVADIDIARPIRLDDIDAWSARISDVAGETEFKDIFEGISEHLKLRLFRKNDVERPFLDAVGELRQILNSVQLMGEEHPSG